jgi:hypothetical protein
MLKTFKSENTLIKKLLLGFALFAILSSCFAGYSGGRAGFSGGSRSFSSGSYGRSYSVGRSGYARSTNASRGYAVRTRSYYGSNRAYSGSNTVIHSHHYSHGGGFGGGGFFSGFLGGYLGGSMANNGTMMVGGGTPVMAQGPTSYHNPIFGGILMLCSCVLLIGIIFVLIMVFKALFCNYYQPTNRW